MSKSNLDEYIKRSDAMEAVEDDYNLCFAMDPTIPQDFAYYKVKRAAVRAIARVHPADVKPVVRGEWIDFGDELDKSAGRHSYQCSHCFTDASYFISGFEWDEWTAPHFCPNCGAEMREHPEIDMMTAKYALPKIDFEERSEQ